MLINRANVDEVFRNVRATFNQSLQSAAAEMRWSMFATLLDTNQIQERMDWIGSLPNWRKWVGDKVIQNLAAHAYTLSCEEYESSIGVKRRDLEADRLGIYRVQATSQGELAAYFPEERVADAINQAFTATCFDGRPFFDTAHPSKDKAGKATTFSNKLTVALSASTQAAALASLGAGLALIRKMRGDQGRPIRVRNVRLVVPEDLREVANLLSISDRLEDGKANPFKGTPYEVWGEIESSTAWFVMGEAGGLKPLILVQRKAPTVVQVTDPDDGHVARTGEFLFSIEADAVAGYTFPQLAVGSTGAG